MKTQKTVKIQKIIPYLLGLSALFYSVSAHAQDAEAGKVVFAQCRACHQIGEGAKNTVGPQLNGLIGRKAGTAPDYNYSEDMKNSGKVWDEQTFATYIKAPKEMIPGTKMIYPGVKDEQKVSNLIAFLKQYNADGTTKAP